MKNYIEVYNNSISKKDFIRTVMNTFKNISLATAERNYYRIKKQQVDDAKKIVFKYQHYEKQQPHDLKIMMVKDMIKYGIKVNRKYLQQYGFNDMEINWLVDAKIIILGEK